MKCKLTGVEGKGISAHIIPRSFYAIDPEDTQPTRLITNIKGHHTKKCPIGIYDNNIVTEEGERIFSDWDNYASELLIKQKSSFKPLSDNGKTVAFQITKYNYTKLKLFFLSVLWRASVTTQQFFQEVSLGPHENTIRDALLKGNPGNSNWFAISIAKWSGHPVGVGMMDPYRTRFNNLNYYVMYLEHYIVYYKVDQRTPGEAFQAAQLKPSSPLIAISRELSTSKELEIMARMVKDKL